MNVICAKIIKLCEKKKNKYYFIRKIAKKYRKTLQFEIKTVTLQHETLGEKNIISSFAELGL